MVETVKKRLLESLNNPKSKENKIIDRHLEKSLSAKEISDIITESISRRINKDLTNTNDPNYTQRWWDVDYKDMVASIGRESDWDFLKWDAHKRTVVDDMNWTDSDEARKRISDMNLHNDETTSLKSDIESGIRDSKKDKKRYIELLLETKAIRGKEPIDQGDPKSIDYAVNNIFQRIDELSAF